MKVLHVNGRMTRKNDIIPGLCECGKPNRHALPGKVHCCTCRGKAEQKRRDAGMQPRAEKPPDEVSRQTRQQRRNKAAGLCRQCRTPSPDRALCERCRSRQKEQRLRRTLPQDSPCAPTPGV